MCAFVVLLERELSSKVSFARPVYIRPVSAAQHDHRTTRTIQQNLTVFNIVLKMKISISTSTSKLSEHSPTRCRGSDSKGGSHYFWVTKCSDSSSSKSRRLSTSSMGVQLGGYTSSPRCEIGHCNRRQAASVDSSGRLVQGPYCPDRKFPSLLSLHNEIMEC